MWDTPKPVVENHDLIGGLQWTDGALDRQMDRTDRERTRKGRGKKVASICPSSGLGLALELNQQIRL